MTLNKNKLDPKLNTCAYKVFAFSQSLKTWFLSSEHQDYERASSIAAQVAKNDKVITTVVQCMVSYAPPKELDVTTTEWPTGY